MNAVPHPQVAQHPASVDAYLRHGWALVPIPPSSKGPRTIGWNLQQNTLKSQTELPTGFGIGLAHAYSGTMALDIDDWGVAVNVLLGHGVDLNALYNAQDAVIVDSGRAGHGKLLYAMPPGVVLPSKKIIIGGATVYELRCATSNGATVQDVLPPSIHPQTNQPYRWAGRGNWMRLPQIPESVLALWQGLLNQERVRIDGTTDALGATWEDIRKAVEHIPADCSRDEWVNVGMALQWAGTQTSQLDQALYLWNEWSKQSETKYPGEREMLTQWNSFKSDKVNSVKVGTLFHIARDHGWVRPMPDIAGLFKATGTIPTAPGSVLSGMRPTPPELDMTLVPKVLATRSSEISSAVGCDPLVPLWAGLAAVCGVVDARTRLELMEGFRVPPILWLMTIGDPGDKKSPGSRPMMTLLKDLEGEDHPRFRKDLLDWELKEACYASAKKASLEYAASPEYMMGGEPPPIPDLPPQPVPVKITVSDITSQKLVRHAAERPRGLLCYLDEMNSWIRKLTDKMGGEDRSAWVVGYESESYDMDRVGTGSIHCDNFAVSIYGNCQPAVFKEHLKAMATDGLIQRFLPAVLHHTKTKLNNPVPDYLTNKDQWEQTLRIVYALNPTTYRLSAGAHVKFREFQMWYEGRKQDERLLQATDSFMTAYGKLEGTVGRLVLVFHLIESPFSTEVDEGTVERVVHLVRSYLIPAFKYALGEIGEVSNFDMWLTDYIIHNCDKGTLTLTTIKNSGRRQLMGNSFQNDTTVIQAMSAMEKACWVMRVDDGSREHQHYAEWAINPALMSMFQEYREGVIQAKQRQLEEIYRLSPHGRPIVRGQ